MYSAPRSARTLHGDHIIAPVVLSYPAVNLDAMLAPTAPTTAASIEHACDALREADRLTAEALSILGRTDVEAFAGLPAEMLLALYARRTGSDARMLVNAAATLRSMPWTAAAFARGILSWGQVRAIVGAVHWVDRAGRGSIDAMVGKEAERARLADPDELLARVDDAVSRSRADLALAREERQMEAAFFAVQGRLDGSSSFYGEADAESTATMLEALDAYADQPVSPANEEAPTRARQRFDALIAILEESLNGGHSDRTRPLPRLIATIDLGRLDLERLDRDARSESARVLWSLAGRPAPLTALATETMMCDATVVPVVFGGGRPVAVGDSTAPISSKLRTALVARDGGCRFPGCRAPVAWCDAHHIRARIHDGPTVIDNLLLLCRRCHRRVHRFRWRITLRENGIMEFARGVHTYASSPRARPGRRE
jgi:hypothetical protein